MPELEQRQRECHLDQDVRLAEHVGVDQRPAQHTRRQPRHRIADDAGQLEHHAGEFTAQRRADQRQPNPEEAAGNRGPGRKKIVKSCHGRHGTRSTRRKKSVKH
ncbi:hypothetical protein ACEQUB_03424 [Ralstonia syzygii]